MSGRWLINWIPSSEFIWFLGAPSDFSWIYHAEVRFAQVLLFTTKQNTTWTLPLPPLPPLPCPSLLWPWLISSSKIHLSKLSLCSLSPLTPLTCLQEPLNMLSNLPPVSVLQSSVYGPFIDFNFFFMTLTPSLLVSVPPLCKWWWVPLSSVFIPVGWLSLCCLLLEVTWVSALSILSAVLG